MSDNSTTRARLLDDGTAVQVFPDDSTAPFPGDSDWARLAAMTEEEIETNAVTDSDNPPMTDAEASTLQPVPNPREIRRRLHLTQEQFAARFDIALGTLRDWEQGVRSPDRTARTLLRIIAHDPGMVDRALASSVRGELTIDKHN